MDYYDLGPFSRNVTTSSDDAQLWFDRGLNWVYGYNHGEAVRGFNKALRADPECARTARPEISGHPEPWRQTP